MADLALTPFNRLALTIAVVSLAPVILLAGALLLGAERVEELLEDGPNGDRCRRCGRRYVAPESHATRTCGVCRWDDIVAAKREA